MATTRKVSAAKTTTSKATTQKANIDKAVDAAILGENTEVTTETKPLSILGFPVLKSATVPYTAIIKQYNVRTKRNEENVDDIYESILHNGIENPLHVTPNMVLLEGHRRLYCATKKSELTGEVEQVDILIVDVPENKIPLYQAKAGLSKPLTNGELSTAIMEFSKRNPDMTNMEIAELFGCSHTTVNKANQVYRASGNLAEDVTKGRISQKSALKIIKLAETNKVNPDEAYGQVLDRETTKNNGTPPIQISGRSVNYQLKQAFPDVYSQFEQEENLKKDNTPSKRDLMRKLVGNLRSVERLDGTVLLTGSFSTSDYQLLKELLAIPSTQNHGVDMPDDIKENNNFTSDITDVILPISTTPKETKEIKDYLQKVVVEKIYESDFEAYLDMQGEYECDYLFINNHSFGEEAHELSAKLNKTIFHNGQIPFVVLGDFEIKKLGKECVNISCKIQKPEFEAEEEQESNTVDLDDLAGSVVEDYLEELDDTDYSGNFE